MFNNKGQITIFIILGIILLIAVSLILYFSFFQKEDRFQKAFAQERVPETFKPVQMFITSCLEGVATDAIIELGKHGGYITLNDQELSEVTFNLNAAQPTRGDAVPFSDSYYVPYWVYLEDDLDCEQCVVSFDKIPSLASMESQINKYIARELPNCINDLSDFKEQGFSIETGEKSNVQSTIAPGHVQIIADYEVSIAKDQTTTTLHTFPIEIPVPLYELYTLADDMISYLADNQTLEAITMTLVSLYSGLDSSRLPPIADSTTGYSTVVWSKTASQYLLQEILSATIPIINFQNTNNEHHITSSEFTPYQQGVYDLLFIEHFDKKYPYDISLLYFDAPLYFDITPQQGDLLMPSIETYEFFENVMPVEQVNTYDFKYDIAYPVIVQLRDKSALAGKGYNFMFAYEVNIKDNRDLLRWYQGYGTTGVHNPIVVSFTPKQGKFKEDGALGTIFNPETNKTSNITYQKPTTSLFCNPNQRDSGEIQISVTDKKTGVVVSDTNIGYQCGNYDTCMVGTTTETGFSSKFPLCQGGVLSIKKQGYEAKLLPLSTEKEKPENIAVELLPLPQLTVEIKKIPLLLLKGLSTTGSSISFAQKNAKSLTADEKVVFNIAKISSSILESSEYLFYDSSSQDKLTLMPGIYSLTATSYNEKGITLKPETVNLGDKSLMSKPIEIKPFVMGGAVIDQETGYFEVKENDLKTGKKITVYIIEFPKPQSTKELIEINNLNHYSKLYHDALLPEIN